MKILFLTNIPSPYMVDFLNELGKYSDLTVIFERAASNVRDKSWKDFRFNNFKGIILKGKNIRVSEELDDQAICPQVIRYIKKHSYDRIIVANPCTPTGIIAILYMKLRKISYAIQSEGGFPKNGKGIKERFKKIIMRNAKLYLSTAELGDQYFIQYGALPDRIHRYPFTSLYQSEIMTELLGKEEKKREKLKLKIPYDKIVISVGRFIEVKGFDIFIEACSTLNKSIGIYMIGGEPTDKYLQQKQQWNMTNLHFINHVNKEIMKAYYRAADVFVLNSRGDTWGLVINEAMAFGLPVISSDKCYAALALIENDKNGYIVSVDDVEGFRNKIKQLLTHDDICKKMGINNLSKSRDYTIENMATVEMKIVNQREYWENE